MSELAVCLCFRDSACYLNEWLLFHRAQDFSRFYLYDNDSGDSYETVLEPWIRGGLVRLRKWPGRAQQQPIYDHCLANVDREVAWLAFLDDDEFLFSSDHRPLRETLEPFAAYAGVAVAWLIYGTSGCLDYADEWVIKRFTRRASAPDNHVKCLVQPRLVVKSTLIGHAFQTVAGQKVVDENFRPMTDVLHPAPTCGKLRINHYITKSWDELIVRRVLRSEANTEKPKPHTVDQWFEWNETWCAQTDDSAQAFIPAVQALAKNLPEQRRDLPSASPRQGP